MNTALNIILAALNPSWLTGPIFDKELRVASRRRRHFVLRSAYLTLLSFFVIVAWIGILINSSGSTAYSISRMSEAGKAVTTTIIWFQFIGLQLVAVILLHNTIGDEIQRGTLAVLLSTPITSLQIVMGKLLSKLLQLGILLALSFPILAIVRVFGGVTGQYLTMGFCVTLTAVLFAGTVSLFCSINTRPNQQRTSQAILILALLYILFFGPAGMAIKTYLLPWFPHSQALSYLLNPFIVLAQETASAINPTGPNQASFSWYHHCLAMLALSVITIVASTWRTRQIMLTAAFGPTKKIKHPTKNKFQNPSSQAIKRVKGNPIIWKELRKPLLGTRIIDKISTILFIAALPTAYILCGIFGSFEEPEVHGIFIGGYMLIGLFRSAAIAAGMITKEKEARTLSPLLTTPLDDEDIIHSKAKAVFHRMLPLWALLELHILVFVAVNIISAIALITIPIILTGTITFAIGIGIYSSFHCKKTSTAAAWTTAIMAFLWFFCPVSSFTNPMFLAITGGGLFSSFPFAACISAIIYGAIGYFFLQVVSSNLRDKLYNGKH